MQLISCLCAERRSLNINNKVPLEWFETQVVVTIKHPAHFAPKNKKQEAQYPTLSFDNK
jgi:hypothetical protein